MLEMVRMKAEMVESWKKHGAAFEQFPKFGRSELQLRTRVVGLREGLRFLFTELLGEEAERFALPDEYAWFLEVLGSSWQSRRGNGMTLYDADSALGVTVDHCEQFWVYRPVDGGMWTTIASWSDKHFKLLCCDRGSEHFGAVMESEDDHPWWSGATSFIEFKSFSEFVASIEKCYW